MLPKMNVIVPLYIYPSPGAWDGLLERKVKGGEKDRRILRRGLTEGTASRRIRKSNSSSWSILTMAQGYHWTIIIPEIYGS
jgi:hypothetical protein